VLENIEFTDTPLNILLMLALEQGNNSESGVESHGSGPAQLIIEQRKTKRFNIVNL
jgi:hypothetical protein